MEMIDRYLQAVRFWLPRKQKDDIIAELSADMHAQVEEREASLGRELMKTEIEALLKERGRPVVVASRYRPQQQYLIGPVLFPVYTFVLKMVALCYLIPWAVIALFLILFSPEEWRVAHLGHSAMETFLAAWNGLWSTAFFAFGIITLVFAVLERAQTTSRFMEDWNPGTLPPVRNYHKIPRANSIAEITVNLAFLFWWSAYCHTKTFGIDGTLQITVGSQWTWFYWGFLLLGIANLTLASVNLARPYWSLLRSILRLASDASGSALFCWLISARIFTEFHAQGFSPEKAVMVANTINQWLVTFFPVAILLSAIIIGIGVWRAIRVHRAQESDARMPA